MRITKDIFLFGGVGYSSNIYVIDNHLLVDTGLGKFFGEIKKSMNLLGVLPEEIKIILNTHCHYDHIGGNKDFEELTGAEIYASELDAENIKTGKNTSYELFDNKFLPSQVTKKLKEGDKIETSNYVFEVIHTPGHTEGSICLYDAYKKTLISGDTLFANSVGRTDLPTGSITKLVDSLNKLKELDVELLLPGHGEYKIFKEGELKILINNLLKELGHKY